MADVFVSYSRKDEERVAMVVAAIEAHGVSVWWDRSLEQDSDFGQRIDAAIDDAKVTVVCWSDESSKSTWVRGEATRADHQGKYVGVLISNGMPPTPFNVRNSANLATWTGDSDNLAFLSVLALVGEKVGRSDIAERATLQRTLLTETEHRLAAEEAARKLREEQERRRAADEQEAHRTALQRAKGLRERNRAMAGAWLFGLTTFVAFSSIIFDPDATMFNKLWGVLVLGVMVAVTGGLATGIVFVLSGLGLVSRGDGLPSFATSFFATLLIIAIIIWSTSVAVHE